MTFLEVSLFATYSGQRCLNVFNVVTLDEPAVISPAYGAAQAMGFVPDEVGFPADLFFDKLVENVSNNVVFNQIRVKDPYDVTDFYSQPFPAGTTGAAAGESMSPAMAFSLFSNQTRLDIAAGQKRFVGVPEAATGNGGVLTGGALGEWAEVADVLSAPMTYDDEGNLLSYRVVVAKKEEYVAPSGKPAYKYFPTLEEQMDNIATGLLWTPREYVSTQTTRQYGKGR